HMKNCPTYIDELTTQQVVDAYFGGYEIEETYEVGDWVYVDWITGARLHKVAETEGIKTKAGKPALKIHGDGNILAPIEITRHATPEEITKEKQRRWWAKHGRNVYEFKEGDLIKREHIVSEVEEQE